MRAVFLGLLCLGCWAATPALAQESSRHRFQLVLANHPHPLVGDYTAIHKIGLINLAEGNLRIGDQVSIFRRSDKVLDVKDWKLDALTLAVVRAYLGNAFEVKPVPIELTRAIPRRDFAAEEREQPTDSGELYKKHLSALPDQGVDAFIVWRPMTNLGEEAITLTRGITNKSFVTVAGFMDLVDARTFSVLGSSMMVLHGKSDIGKTLLVYPSIELDRKIEFTDPIGLSDDELTRYRALISNLIVASVPVTLHRLGLPQRGGGANEASPMSTR